MKLLKNWILQRPFFQSAALLLALGNGAFLLGSQLVWWLLLPAMLWSLPVISVVHLLLSAVLLSLHRWLFDLNAQIQTQQQSDQELTSRVDELLQDAYLPLSRDSSLPDRLVLLRQTLQHQLRREQEIRQLVRVQGLVDHELAIGNRIYFESKLQHYLLDPADLRPVHYF